MEVKYIPTIWPSHSIPKHLLKRNESMLPYKDLYTNVQTVLLIIANTNWHKCLSTDEWNKGNSGKFIQQNTTQQSKEWTVGTCNNIAESQNINNYGEYKKPDKKRIYTKWLCL